MSPFQVFRLWLRRAPLAQKAASGVAAAAVLAVLVWAVVPATTHSKLKVSAFGGAGFGGQASAGQAGQLQSSGTSVPGTGTASATTTSGTAAGTGGSAAAASAAGGTGGGCVPPPGSATGVSANTINIAVLIVNIAGPVANGTFGIASPQSQQAAFQAVINNINSTGGVACRKLVPTFYNSNPADQTSLQQLCVTLTQAHIYAVMDPGAYANYPTGLDCLGQNHIAYFGGYMFAASQLQQFSPYLFDFNTLDNVYHDAVYALKQLGGFQSVSTAHPLGIIYRTCYPELFKEVVSWLAKVGIPSSEISAYSFGCPQVLASPSDEENAVVQFETAGVQEMTEIEELGDMPEFTSISQHQHFNPRWLVGDDALLQIASGSQAPDPQNMDNAIAVTENRDAENNTPGLSASPGAGTQRCDAIMKTVGLAPVYNQPAAIGNACDQLWMFQTALAHAPAMSPAALIYGLQRAGSIDFSYPQGPNNFSAPGTLTAGQFWRVAQFSASCGSTGCWKVTDPNWHPSFGY